MNVKSVPSCQIKAKRTKTMLSRSFKVPIEFDVRKKRERETGNGLLNKQSPMPLAQPISVVSVTKAPSILRNARISLLFDTATSTIAKIGEIDEIVIISYLYVNRRFD